MLRYLYSFALFFTTLLPLTSVHAQASLNMSKVGQLVGGPARAIVHADGHSYVAADGIFYVLDTSNAVAPQLVYQELTPGGSRGVTLHAGYLYLAAGLDGVRIFDRANPALPVEVGSFDTPGSARYIRFDGTRMFVADDAGGVRILDATNPIAPVFLGSYSGLYLYVGHLQAVGNTLYVAAMEWELDIFVGRLLVLDIQNPAAPALLGVHALGGGSGDGARVIADDAPILLSTGGYGIQQIYLVSPTVSLPLSSAPVGEVHDMRKIGSQLWVNGAFDVTVFDLSGGTWTELGSLPLSGRGGAFDIVAGTIHRAASEQGAQIIDAGDVSQMNLLGIYNSYVDSKRVSLHGAQAIVVDAELWSVDISDASLPAISKKEDFLTREFVVDGDVGFAASNVEIRSYDLSGGSFAHISSLALAGNPQDLVRQGDHLYVADYANGLRIFEIADPANMQLAGELVLPSGSRYVATHGNVVYLARYGLGLSVIDATNLASPSEVDLLPVAVNRLHVVGDRLYVAAGASGALVYDLADPLAPSLLGAVGDDPGANVGFAQAVGNRLFVGNGSDHRVSVHDVTDPAAPQLLAYYELPDIPTDVEVDGDLVYVTVYRKGLYVLSLDLATAVEPSVGATTLLSNYPNPFSTRTTLAFRPATSGLAQLQVFDLAGRLVRGWQRPVDAGIATSVAWDGRDARGMRVASGVYQVKLTLGDESIGKRIVLLR